MYEIAKRKNLAARIVLALILLFILNFVIKNIFNTEASINDKLVKVANEINKHTPIIVDSMTRCDNVIALTGNKLQYNYTITNLEKKEIDTTILLSSVKEHMLNIIKTNPKVAFFRDNNVDFIASYSDKKGNYVCSALFSHNDYK